MKMYNSEREKKRTKGNTRTTAMGVHIASDEVIVPTNALSSETCFIVLERISTQNKTFTSFSSSEGNIVVATMIRTGLFSYEQLKTRLIYYYHYYYINIVLINK